MEWYIERLLRCQLQLDDACCGGELQGQLAAVQRHELNRDLVHDGLSNAHCCAVAEEWWQLGGSTAALRRSRLGARKQEHTFTCKQVNPCATFCEVYHIPIRKLFTKPKSMWKYCTPVA